MNTKTNQPHQFNKRILLAVSGLSPQILTETLYALAVDNKNATFIPTEIHLITTLEGAQRAELQLLHLGNGRFHQLCKDYQLPKIEFNNNHVHVIQDAQGNKLNDIVTPEDNENAANFITGIVNHLTQDEDTALHVSIAGGRKTMGYFLGYALTLLGREQDRLSHVLVDSAYEGIPEFFYPTPKSHVIYNRTNQPLDTQAAKVTLAEIPFLPLRYKIPPQVLKENLKFNTAIQYARLFNTGSQIEIDKAACCLSINYQKIPLTYVNFIFYLWLTEQMIANGQPIKRLANGNMAYADSFLKLYQQHQPRQSETDPTLKLLTHSGMEGQWIAERVSRVNKTLEETLGQHAKEIYCIEMRGKNHAKECVLPQSSLQVEFV